MCYRVAPRWCRPRSTATRASTVRQGLRLLSQTTDPRDHEQRIHRPARRRAASRPGCLRGGRARKRRGDVGCVDCVADPERTTRLWPACPPAPRIRAEAFYVLEGEYLMYIEDRRTLCRPGTFVYVPRNTAHTFKVVSAEPGKKLNLFSPAAMVGFFEELALRRSGRECDTGSVGRDSRPKQHAGARTGAGILPAHASKRPRRARGADRRLTSGAAVQIRRLLRHPLAKCALARNLSDVPAAVRRRSRTGSLFASRLFLLLPLCAGHIAQRARAMERQGDDGTGRSAASYSPISSLNKGSSRIGSKSESSRASLRCFSEAETARRR